MFYIKFYTVIDQFIACNSSTILLHIPEMHLSYFTGNHGFITQ